MHRKSHQPLTVRVFEGEVILGARPKHIVTITLSLNEGVVLAKHLSGIIAKGSISTTPSWAKKIIFKIEQSARRILKEK